MNCESVKGLLKIKHINCKNKLNTLIVKINWKINKTK